MYEVSTTIHVNQPTHATLQDKCQQLICVFVGWTVDETDSEEEKGFTEVQEVT